MYNPTFIKHMEFENVPFIFALKSSSSVTLGPVFWAGNVYSKFKINCQCMRGSHYYCHYYCYTASVVQ